MENLVNKKVRFQHRLTKTTLIACSDQKSVSHIRLDDNKPKPGNSVWIIKGTKPDKAIRIESVYGKLLAWKGGTGLIVMQADRPPPQDKVVDGVHNWWKFEDVDQSGFINGVRIKSRIKTDRCVFLCPDNSTSQVTVGLTKELSWWMSWFVERLYTWDLEIVEDPINDQGRVIHKSKDNPPVTPPVVAGIPSTSYTYHYQVDRLYVYQEGRADTPFPFPNYANTGRNVNESGTQIIGGVNVQTQIDNFVNNKIVKRSA